MSTEVMKKIFKVAIVQIQEINLCTVLQLNRDRKIQKIKYFLSVRETKGETRSTNVFSILIKYIFIFLTK